MDEAELQRIDRETNRRWESNLICAGTFNDVNNLIVEVRRLKAELKKRPNVSLEYIGRLPPSIFTEDDL